MVYVHFALTYSETAQTALLLAVKLASMDTSLLIINAVVVFSMILVFNAMEIVVQSAKRGLFSLKLSTASHVTSLCQTAFYAKIAKFAVHVKRDLFGMLTRTNVSLSN
jgi:hypothetical protein